MAASSSSSSNDLQEVLKPFYQRASEAEDRLARLETALGSTKDSGNGDLTNKVAELQSQLENAKAVQALEREKSLKKVQELAAENAKLQYRITHLVRALKEADSKLESK